MGNATTSGRLYSNRGVYFYVSTIVLTGPLAQFQSHIQEQLGQLDSDTAGTVSFFIITILLVSSYSSYRFAKQRSTIRINDGHSRQC
jgi:hypothetical protein